MSLPFLFLVFYPITVYQVISLCWSIKQTCSSIKDLEWSWNVISMTYIMLTIVFYHTKTMHDMKRMFHNVKNDMENVLIFRIKSYALWYTCNSNYKKSWTCRVYIICYSCYRQGILYVIRDLHREYEPVSPVKPE
jgi:hypothetical protein